MAVDRMVFGINLVGRRGRLLCCSKGLHGSIERKYQVTCVAVPPCNTVGEVLWLKQGHEAGVEWYLLISRNCHSHNIDSTKLIFIGFKFSNICF